MGKSSRPITGRAAGLIDDIAAQSRVLARAQARRAELMAEFFDERRELDERVISRRGSAGGEARYRAGEFAANEVSMAVKASRYATQRTVAMTRRVRAEAPDAWDAWVAGDIDQDKVVRINRALRRLERDSSKAALNTVVVDLAVCRTPEILGRCLNQFILQVEPDLQDERLRRSWADRYVSVRPDLDGISFLSAALSAVDAQAIDQVLTALAGVAGPGDPRTVQQRRADAMVDVLLGRVSNGCHVSWDVNSDRDDHLDDPPDLDDPPEPDESDQLDVSDQFDESDQFDVSDQLVDSVAVADSRELSGLCDVEDLTDLGDSPDRIASRDLAHGDGSNGVVSSGHDGPGGGQEGTAAGEDGAGEDGAGEDGAVQEWAAGGWDAADWDRPAGAFRPDAHQPPPDDAGIDPGPGRATVSPCPGGGRPRPLPVTIGIVVTAQSLFGFTNTPGQLLDRSASVPADRIRELAGQEGTLFHRLLTDERGNLLDVTELGRFPSRKLGLAVKFRSGVCESPICTVPAHRCDVDHQVPVPEGPTAGPNLGPKCRAEHRAKTLAGHRSRRTGPHTTEWVTPTGHVYLSHDEPFMIENWPTAGDSDCGGEPGEPPSGPG